MDNITIREIEESDVKTVSRMYIDLYNACYEYGMYFRLNEDFLDDYIQLFVNGKMRKLFIASVECECAGFAACSIAKPARKFVLPNGKKIFGSFDELYVEPKYRKHRIGKLLYGQVENYFRENGVDYEQLIVLNENEGAIGFHEKARFKAEITTMSRKID